MPGEVAVYPPHGKYQLIVRKVEQRGEGALQQALRKLHQRLAAEGLFDAERKRPLPRFPRRIGLVTSSTGAAVRDFLEVVRRRWRGVYVLVIPTRVQGAGAGREIAAAIGRANRLKEPLDVLVVGRGGGSLEDLWCFNEEEVVRAIAASYVPVVSAVGHEIDVTLSDLVADVRAATPTEAAEHVVPAQEDVESSLAGLRTRLTSSLRASAAAARARVDSLAERRVLRRPLERIHDLARRVEELDQRAGRAVKRQLSHTDENLSSLSARLEALSPLAVLARGYSVTFRGDAREPLTDAASLSIGEQLTTRFLHGQAVSRIEQVQPDAQRDDQAGGV